MRKNDMMRDQAAIANDAKRRLSDLETKEYASITEHTPASASATGIKGQVCWDANYIYVCVATDTWKRVAISTW